MPWNLHSLQYPLGCVRRPQRTHHSVDTLPSVMPLSLCTWSPFFLLFSIWMNCYSPFKKQFKCNPLHEVFPSFHRLSLLPVLIALRLLLQNSYFFMIFSCWSLTLDCFLKSNDHVLFLFINTCSSDWHLAGAHYMFVEGMNEDEETEAQTV